MQITKPHLTSYQKKILFSKARFTITEAGTKTGKTHSHILWLFGKAHEYEVALGFNYWWVAPVYSQSKIAFNRLRLNLVRYGVYRFNETSLIIYCPNGAEIHFKTADKPDNLYGEDVHAAVFDEASRAKEHAWTALYSTLAATKAPCKLIGNFKGISNWVHKLKELMKNDPNWDYFKVTCWDAVDEGILELDIVLQAQKTMHPRMFSELWEAEPTEDEGQLINNESIVKLFSNTHIEEGAKYITADIARMGRDKTVIYLWDGLRVIEVIEMDVSKVTESAAAIKKLQDEHNVNTSNIIVDEDGVGGGVVDILGCIGFVNNSTPIKIEGKKENFVNLKVQCYWKLAQVINRNEIYVDCDPTQGRMLTEELEWVRLPKEIDAQKINILSKDEIKKNIGRSPDYSDALMMRMYFMVDPHRGQLYVYM